MPRQRTATFTTIRTEGGLLPSDLLAGVASLEKAIPGLSTADYHLVKGENLGNRITESWNKLTAAWKHFTEQLAILPESDQGTTLTRDRWLQPLFGELGFGRLQTTRAIEVDGKSYPVSHGWGSVPIHLVSCRTPIDRRSAGVKGAAGASPHSMVQEVLNRSSDHLWAFVSNGLVLRILRDNASLTRQAFVEFDLEKMMADGVYDDFVVLWLTCHQSRVEADDPAECWLEKWTKVAAESGTRARDDLRAGVEKAIEALGAGFVAHPANTALRDNLRSGSLSTHDYYRQLLRVIYRLLFLFVAEDRQLLHPPGAGDAEQRRYARYYSLSRVRTIAGRRRGGPHPDLWASLVTVFQGLGRPDGIPSLGVPGLGSFLWSDAACQYLDTAQISNQHLLTAVRNVGFVEDANEQVLRPVDYRNLGSEELGAIYESLLEQHPEVNTDAGTFTLNTAAGNERKTTGSYYTPTSLITELLDSAVDPVVAEAARQPDPEAAILGLSVIDPACGSGHFLIAAAHRIAKRLAAIRTGDDEPSPDATRTALRDVIAHCVHGIDLNPMAVELCKVSLWMESMEPGKPLGFLDHRIVRGNGFIGATPELLDAGVPDDAFKPLTGDDKTVMSGLKTSSKRARAGQGRLFATATSTGNLAAIARAVGEIDDTPDANVVAVQAKAKRWSDLVDSEDYRTAVHAADTWCAAFVAPKTKDSPAITHAEYEIARDEPGNVDVNVRNCVEQLADQYAFLHWHLAFPDVYAFGGGFNVVLGNPPWKRLTLDDSKFFARRAPDILKTGTTAQRKKAIEKLFEIDPLIAEDYRSELRFTDAMRHFAQESGRFPFGSGGRTNTFGLFADLGRREALRGASVGMVLPSAILTDVPFQGFSENVLSESLLASFLDFENSAPIFQDVHRQFRFSIITLRRTSDPRPIRVAFNLHDPSDLSEAGKTYLIDPSDLVLINPRTKQMPSCSSVDDFNLLRRIHLQTATFGESGHPYAARAWVGLTSDAHSDQFVDSDGIGLTPVFEAKMIHQFDSRFASYEGVSQEARLKGKPRRILEEVRPAAVMPRYWISETLWNDFAMDKVTDGYFIGLRDVTNSSNERTTIAALLKDVAVVQPLNGVSSAGGVEELLIVLGALNSLVVDYVTRLKILGTHLNVTTFSQLPAPPADLTDELRGLILDSVTYLCGVALIGQGESAHLDDIDSQDMEDDDIQRFVRRALLDAAFAYAFNLDAQDLGLVLSSFPLVQKREEKMYGTYITGHLVKVFFECLSDGRSMSSLLDQFWLEVAELRSTDTFTFLGPVED